MQNAIVLFIVLGTAVVGAATPKSDNGFPTLRTFLGPKDFNILGRVVRPKLSRLCKPTAENLTGGIALVGPNTCLLSDKAWNAQKAGAIGVLAIEYRSTPGLLYYNWGGKHDNDVSIPVVEVSAQDAEGLEEGVEVILVPDENPMVEFGEGPWVVYTVFLGIYNAMILGYAVMKLFHFIHSEGQHYLPLLVLGVNIFTCLLRVPLLLDPNGSRGFLSWQWVELFMTIDFSFAIVAALLIAFHWDAATHISGFKFELGRYKWPGFIACGVIVTWEVMTSVLRALLLSAKLFLIVKVVMYLLYSLVIAVYFFWNCRKISAGKKDMQIYAGFALSGCLVLFPLTAFLVPTPLYTTPLGYFMLRFLASLWLYIAGALQIFMFAAPKIIDIRSTNWVATADTGSITPSVSEEEMTSSEEEL